MTPFITDKMFSLAFWIWDRPGLAHDRWITAPTEDGIMLIEPDTWIGRIADNFAGWLYRVAATFAEDEEYDWDNGIILLDEADSAPVPTPAQIQLITMVSNDD